jgi:antitoxin VapB
MALHVKNPATDRAVRRLAKLKGATLTDTIREAVEAEYARVLGRVRLADRLRVIQDQVAARSRPGGEPADKDFFDELSGE